MFMFRFPQPVEVGEDSWPFFMRFCVFFLIAQSVFGGRIWFESIVERCARRSMDIDRVVQVDWFVEEFFVAILMHDFELSVILREMTTEMLAMIN